MEFGGKFQFQPGIFCFSLSLGHAWPLREVINQETLSTTPRRTGIGVGLRIYAVALVINFSMPGASGAGSRGGEGKWLLPRCSWKSGGMETVRGPDCPQWCGVHRLIRRHHQPRGSVGRRACPLNEVVAFTLREKARERMECACQVNRWKASPCGHLRKQQLPSSLPKTIPAALKRRVSADPAQVSGKSILQDLGPSSANISLFIFVI